MFIRRLTAGWNYILTLDLSVLPDSAYLLIEGSHLPVVRSLQAKWQYRTYSKAVSDRMLDRYSMKLDELSDGRFSHPISGG